MPNQAQQTAESNPKVKKAAAKKQKAAATTPTAAATTPTAAATTPTAAATTPKASKADKPAKATKAAAPAKNAATPKTPRKRTPAGETHSANDTHAAPPPVADVGSSELQILTEVSYEMIAVRAYFLAENRQNHGISGDHSSDWHQAENQLRAEAAAIAASLNHTP